MFVESSRYALLCASLGEKERAIDALTRGEKEGKPSTFWFWAQSPEFDSIREDPRFKALLRKYRLPTDPLPGSVAGRKS